MSKADYPKAGKLDGIKEFLLRFAASGYFPATAFIKNRPVKSELAVVNENIKLEIVSHCWNYARFFVYQLSSLVKYPPKDMQVKLTVYYSAEDTETTKLLQHFSTIAVANVEWNFIELATPLLLRRAIGRNQASKATKADWIWFADCDMVFHEGCLDTLSELLKGRQEILLFPDTLLVTPLLTEADPMISAGKDKTELLEVDTTKFKPRKFDRATGAIQILHGDVARACGYCDDLAVYQKPKYHWTKTYEDRAIRWLLGTHGVPIALPNLLLIRHAEKGRYKEDSKISVIRKAIRRVKSALINK
ncbi:glycosyltransferase family 2 protein [Rheinheimera sp. WS51]|uniref:glycosyltransferase family 2 protein n=1 Tax=Rheinheimera sp. WS51 TaxID=3425886 RepID=UPI003D9372A7